MWKVWLVAVAFVGPLWLTGELGMWSMPEPVSSLVWDEAMEGPGDDGVTAPGPGDALATPLRAFVGLLALPLALSVLVAGWARRI